MALGGACDKGVYRTAGSLLIFEPLVSHNCPIRKTSETSWKDMLYSGDVAEKPLNQTGSRDRSGINK